MQLDPAKLSNWMILTLLILISSATLGVVIASAFFTGAAAMSALLLGPLALITTLPMALAFASLVNLLILVVPVWGLVGGYWIASLGHRGLRQNHNPLGVTLFSETHPIHQRVNELAQQLDLPPIKWVGWTDHWNINAFAMGLNQADALIAFSHGAIKQLSKDELDAVMGHELAHVVNHDMQRMTFAYGVQRSLTWFLVWRKLKAFARWGFTPIAELEILRFSRQREYWADAIGAVLTSPQAMVGALNKIAENAEELAVEQKPFASFMLHANAHTFLRTHPRIPDRVQALQTKSYIQRLPMKQAGTENATPATQNEVGFG